MSSFGDHRIAKFVRLVIILDDRPGQGRALRDTEPLGQGAGGDVADHDLDRDDLDFPDQLLTHVEAADEVGRNADFRQTRHEVFGNAVVQHSLAGDHAALLIVEGGGIVFEVLHQSARLRSFEQNLCLALVDPPAS